MVGYVYAAVCTYQLTRNYDFNNSLGSKFPHQNDQVLLKGSKRPLYLGNKSYFVII